MTTEVNPLDIMQTITDIRRADGEPGEILILFNSGDAVMWSNKTFVVIEASTSSIDEVFTKIKILQDAARERVIADAGRD